MKKLIITQIRYLKTKTELVFNDKSKLRINDNVIFDLNLHINKIIDEEDLETFKKLSKIEDNLKILVKKFRDKNYTTGQILKFLDKSDLDDLSKQEVVNRLENCGLLNEEIYLKECLDLFYKKHLGYFKIVEKLRSLKFKEEYIKSVKYDLNRENSEAEKLILINKNKYAKKNNFMQRKSLYALLVRKGYSKELSLEVVDKFVFYDNNHERNVLKLDYDKIYHKFLRRFSENELRDKIREHLISQGYSLEDIKYVEELSS